MKRILIFVISVLFSVNLTGQIGIDLTEMVNAPDSGYIIITTGDEYPERGLQKYVAFDSLIPLDTIFRKADSVCLQFAYQSAPVCFFIPDSANANQNLAYVRDGDTIRISISGGNTISFRDSTRSNQDITTVIRDSIPTVDSVWHKGDSIIIRMTDGHRWAVRDSFLSKQDVATIARDSLVIPEGTHLIGVTHQGDSIRFDMSDASHFTVRDSFVDAATIQQWISDSIPDIVFYVKTGQASTAVEWHDTVTINGATINVNTTEIEVTYDSLTHSLEFCQYTTIIDTIAVQDTGLIFSGTNQYLREATVPTVQFDLPIEITFSVDAMPSASQALIGRRYINNTANTFDVWLTPTGMQLHLVSPTNTIATIDFPFIATPGVKYTYKVEEDDLGGLVQYIDGVEMKRDQSWPRPGTFSGSYQFRIAARDYPPYDYFEGTIYYARVGDERWYFTENTGSTTTGTQSTVLDLINSPTWTIDERDVAIEVPTRICDTLYLDDIHLDTAIYDQDTLYLHMTDGRVYKAEIIASGHDGKSLEFNWDGTQLGVRVEGDPTYDYVDLQGPQGIQGEQGPKGDEGEQGPKGSTLR